MLLTDVRCGVLHVNVTGGPGGGPLVVRKAIGEAADGGPPTRWVTLLQEGEHFTLLVKKVADDQVTAILTDEEVEMIITHHAFEPNEVPTVVEPENMLAEAALLDVDESFYKSELRY